MNIHQTLCSNIHESLLETFFSSPQDVYLTDSLPRVGGLTYTNFDVKIAVDS